jgi:hypothetical protein
MIPNRENGARDERFLTMHSGRRISDVTPMRDLVLVVVIENVDRRPRIESASIIEYDRFPMKQSNADDNAMIHDVLVPRVLSQQSAYDVAPVILHTRAMSMKVYADMAPMAVVMIVAGMSALGAFPNAAMPGRHEYLYRGRTNNVSSNKKEGCCDGERISTFFFSPMARVGDNYYLNGKQRGRDENNKTNNNSNAPAGKLNTPAPMMLFTRLKTSSGMVAVPSVDTASPPPPPPPPPDIPNAVIDHGEAAVPRR